MGPTLEKAGLPYTLKTQNNPRELLTGLWAMFFLNCKYARQVEAELYLSFTPLVGGFGNKGAFVHAAGIGQMQLEYVTAGLDVHPYREGIGACCVWQPVS